MNYVIARSTSQQTCASFKRGMCLFGDHPFSFTTSGSAADHQFHHPKRNYGVCFNRQHHQGSELPPPHCRALIDRNTLGVKAPMNGAFSRRLVMVMVVDDRLTASTVLVLLFYDGGAVGRLSLFNYGRVVPIPVVVVVLAHSYASANRANAYPNTNIISEGGRGESRCGSQNQYELHQKSPPVI
jgi:hypothetical protein